MSEHRLDELKQVAIAAKSVAYCPYSKFRVGAAVLGKNDKIYSGCNVENCSYPCGCCAEVTASAKAVSDGCTQFSLIVIASDTSYFLSPCGQCRQFLSEFSDGKTKVVSVNKDNITETWTMEDLLPLGFNRNFQTDLNKEAI